MIKRMITQNNYLYFGDILQKAKNGEKINYELGELITCKNAKNIKKLIAYLFNFSNEIIVKFNKEGGEMHNITFNDLLKCNVEFKDDRLFLINNKFCNFINVLKFLIRKNIPHQIVGSNKLIQISL